VTQVLANSHSRLLPLGFAFDIVRTPSMFITSHDAAQDGVLLHGANVLPEAKRALSILEGDNPLNRYFYSKYQRT
jgi:hypothetical protein